MAANGRIPVARQRYFESQNLNVCFHRKRSFSYRENRENNRPETATSGRRKPSLAFRLALTMEFTGAPPSPSGLCFWQRYGSTICQSKDPVWLTASWSLTSDAQTRGIARAPRNTPGNRTRGKSIHQCDDGNCCSLISIT